MGASRLPIEEALARMAAQVQHGEFTEAAETGSLASIPLGVPRADLHIGKAIFSGQQGSVLRGTFHNEPVAVKKARIGTHQDLDNFKKEVLLMSRICHPNVISLRAARVLPPDYMLVMPLEGDNVAHMLHQQGWRPGWRQVVSLALDVARGMAAVHQAGILHRDIKTANLLMGNNGCLKLGDFGLAEVADDLAEEQADRSNLVGKGKPSGGFHKRHLVGTLEYMAPEVLFKEPTTRASDVYAWAVAVNEMATGVFPFADCTKDNPQCQTILNFGYGRQELAAAVAAEGLRPILAPDTPAPLAALLEAAWQLAPGARPAAARLEAELAALLARMDASPTPAAHAIPASTIGPAPVLAAQENGNGDAQAPPPKAHSHSNGAAAAPEQDRAGAQGWGVARWERDGGNAVGGFQPKVSAGAFETAGLRGEDKMEDRCFILSPLEGPAPDTHLIGVFDGHRGPEAAEYAARHFEEHLRRQWAQAATPEQALRCAFVSLDDTFAAQEDAEWAERVARMGRAAGERRWPGATAIVLLLAAGRLYTANAGDCRAVLCSKGEAVALSEDQTADREDERARIQAAGGRVQFRLDGWRLGAAGIQVSRCLGDHDLKAEGLTADPEVTCRELSDDDMFVIAASDGLWDKCGNTEAVNIVHDTVKEPGMVAKRLATEALTRGSGDNITVVVAFLQPVSTLERIYADGRQKYGAHQMFLPATRVIRKKADFAATASADEWRDTY